MLCHKIGQPQDADFAIVALATSAESACVVRSLKKPRSILVLASDNNGHAVMVMVHHPGGRRQSDIGSLGQVSSFYYTAMSKFSTQCAKLSQRPSTLNPVPWTLNPGLSTLDSAKRNHRFHRFSRKLACFGVSLMSQF